jgi:D-alanyl-D-alanine carboxypeptidase/D-alanyl-D-alanine-endopeptidase (penicillin-binding protein 4)
VLFLILASIGACRTVWSGEPVKAAIEAVIDGPDYRHAHWGILVTDLETGQVVFDLNPDKLFAPASTTKLYSVAAALDALGADYRFETRIHRVGAVSPTGELQGVLILEASGDLSMGGRTNSEGRITFKDSDHTYANGNETAELTEPDPLAGLNELARQVAAAGIKRVRGEVIINDGLFDKAEGTGSGPGRLTPIMINDNVVDILVTPRKVGEPAHVTWRPETVAFAIDALVDTAPAGVETSVTVTAAGPGKLTVRGRIAAGHRPLVRVHEVEDAASFARTLLIEALRRAGVVVDASAVASNRLDARPGLHESVILEPVAKLTSPPFSESAKLILKVSHNLHASTLPLLVAVKRGERTLEQGLRLQHDFLERVGVDVETISFGGGAGGSRADYTTPRATVQLLRYMSTRQDFAAYQAALPILGVDGTLASAVASDSPAKGHAQAKTGTLFWKNVMNDRYLLTSKALAGYMTAASGRRLAFAMFVNNTHLERASDTTREGKALGRVCETIFEKL